MKRDGSASDKRDGDGPCAPPPLPQSATPVDEPIAGKPPDNRITGNLNPDDRGSGQREPQTGLGTGQTHGAISQYNNTTPVKGPANYLSLLVNRARMQGIVVFDYADRYHLGVAEMAAYLKAGRNQRRQLPPSCRTRAQAKRRRTAAELRD